MLEKLFFKVDNYILVNFIENDNVINLFVKSKIKSCSCPCCGVVSNKYHSTYVRKIQDTPIHNKETWLNVSAYEFVCQNPDCKVTTFTENLPFARKNKVKTDALIQFILAISICLSSTSASLILSFLGVKISPDSIDNLLKKVEIKDNPDIESIGIDEVATRKGIHYATAIYDLNDHHLIALLDGRDSNTVKEWLVNHKKIKMVARDRASAYASAISEILPKCTQVADRFHLFANLLEYLKEIFNDKMPKNIYIYKDEIIEKEQIPKVKVTEEIDEEYLNKLEYDNTEPLDENGEIIKFYKKRYDLSKDKIKRDENRIKKILRIKTIKEKLKTTSVEKIMEDYHITKRTINRYAKLNNEDIEKMFQRKEYNRKNPNMEDYINIIYKMIKDNIKQEYIYLYIKKKGCKLTKNSIYEYINLIIKNNNMKYKNYTEKMYIKHEYPKDLIIIKKNEILKNILTIEKNRKEEKINKYIEKIKNKYEVVKKVEIIFKDFHDVMFSKDEEMIDIFIEMYQKEIEPFCKSIKKDIAPVKNAISYTINSGFVEGNNNKFKLIKRIVYGKQKLCNLFKKSYLNFLITTNNFNIEEIVESVLYEKNKNHII